MKKIKISIALFLLLILHSISSFAQTSPCANTEIESLPIQSNGRVKPFATHAKEVVKFITGKSSYEGWSATETYCRWSMQFFSETNAPEVPFRLDHVDTKAFFKLKPEDKSISSAVALDRMAELAEYTNVIKSRNENKGLADDLAKLLNRTQLFAGIIQGEDWKIPILKNHGTDDTAIQADQIEWISIASLKEIFPEHISDANSLIQSSINAGKNYTDKVSQKHLTELTYEKLHLFHAAILVSLLALGVCVYIKQARSLLPGLLVLLTLGLQITAIVFRTTISGRAPVTNMYETVMWVALGSLTFAFILAMIRKEKMFLYVGLTMNILCLFMMSFANNMLDPSIQPLVPVLRDNFWLSTHVTMITISYAALALSWLIGNVYMIRCSFSTVSNADTQRFQLLAYDCIKIGVVLLAGGIILGGVWADYSWGRFWGWDPKETWSLIAFMTYMAILHGRYSGWINKQRFLSAATLAFLTIIMAWFGVNYILAAGLHSYGFSNGGAVFISAIVAAQLAIFGLYALRTQTWKKV